MFKTYCTEYHSIVFLLLESSSITLSLLSLQYFHMNSLPHMRFTINIKLATLICTFPGTPPICPHHCYGCDHNLCGDPNLGDCCHGGGVQSGGCSESGIGDLGSRGNQICCDPSPDLGSTIQTFSGIRKAFSTKVLGHSFK